MLQGPKQLKEKALRTCLQLEPHLHAEAGLPGALLVSASRVSRIDHAGHPKPGVKHSAEASPVRTYM